MLRSSPICSRFSATSLSLFASSAAGALRRTTTSRTSTTSTSPCCSSSCCSCPSAPSAALASSTLTTATRPMHHQPPTNIGYGSMVPFQGFISPDMISGAVPGGGQHKRGVIAVANIGYDREIIRVPAYLLHVSDQKRKDQIRHLMRVVLKRFVEDRRHASYISKRLMSMMIGGNPIFRTEEDLRELVLDVEGASLLFQKGLITSLDLHRLACALNFNRVECEYRGQQGIAIFPELSYFNHSCEPNVALTYSWDSDTGDYVCVGRTLKPVNAGDQLVIHYFPNDMDLPLSRFQRKLQERWSFTCLCNVCRTRTVLATLTAGFFFMVTVFVPLAAYSVWQRKEKLVQAGIA